MRKRLMRRTGEIGRAIDPQVEIAPVSEAEVSSTRPRTTGDVPREWLERLLVGTMDLPIASGDERSVAFALLQCVSSILGSYAVGTCLQVGDEQAIFRRLPLGYPDRPGGAHPARLFPGFKYEYVVPLPGAYPSPTLHLASDEDDLEIDNSPAAHFLERAAFVLGHALLKTRTAGTAIAKSGGQSHANALDRRMMQADKLATFGQLAAGVVHELNNPLTSIVAYSDYLIRKVADGTGKHDGDDIERLRRISESANRMLRFTRELVGYARPSNGTPGVVPLHRVIDQAVAFCEHLFSAAGVTVERHYVTGPLEVHGVAEQLVQVFVNLLTNACQAAPMAAGRIVLTTERHNAASPRVVVIVEDNGSGIAPENLQHLFVPFFTTKRETHGTGLGLSIIKNIVGSHDGTIRVESEIGQGTRFFVDLPLLDA